MSPQEILNHLRKRPFVPFRVYLSDGAFYDVRHPENALVTRTHVDIALPVEDGGVPEHSVFCDPIHVTRIEPLVGPENEIARRREPAP